jgi:hypothetical protein
MKTNSLFKLLTAGLLYFIVIYVVGCGSNSVTNPLGGSVTFTMSQQPGATGIQFLAKPSADCRITRVICNLPAQNIADTLTSNFPNYLYSKDTSYIINEYSGVATGQQWNFVFTGTDAANAAYTTTSNYTIP